MRKVWGLLEQRNKKKKKKNFTFSRSYDEINTTFQFSIEQSLIILIFRRLLMVWLLVIIVRIVYELYDINNFNEIFKTFYV